MEQKLPQFKKNYPAFRFMGGNLVSFFGDQIYLIAIPLIVLSITGSPLSMGIIVALQRIPVWVAPLTGIIADRFNRRRLLLLCDLVRCILLGLIGALFIFGRLEMWLLYSVVLVIGAMGQIYQTGQFAAIPHLVRKDDLQAINSLSTGIFNLSVLIAPSVGGLIISLYNPGYALIINSVCFFLSFLAVSSIKLPFNGPKSKEVHSIAADLKEGFVFVLRTKEILYTNLALIVSVFGSTLFITIMIFHLRDTIQLTAVEIGWLLSFGGLGAIGGAWLTNVISKRVPFQKILFCAALLGGISIILFSVSKAFIFLVISNALGTIAVSAVNPCIVTIRQTLTPQHLLGRVQATSRFMTWILVPFSAFLAGVIADFSGTHTTILIGGIISTFGSFIYLHPILKKTIKFQ
ncbi:MFS transporter [Bacillus horti]|uniref:MFS family permease n=1 Tax=Caldalkalibacillus horti TaxID=77523 RepID=A0ABT9W2V3_9BACI|nr:MFS transporter [Bacillus horti]MDQ0167404.1 MFS family permease [Bacillus horti]